MGSGKSNQNFVATVGIRIDPAEFDALTLTVQDKLKKAVEGFDASAFSKLVEASKSLNAELAKVVLAQEKINLAQAKTTTQEEKAAKAAADRIAAEERANQVIARGLAQQNTKQQKYDDALRKLNEQIESLNRVTTKEQEQLSVESQLSAALAEQNKLLNEQAAISERVKNATPNLGVNPNFNLQNLGGALGSNFISTLFSGGGLNSAISSSLGQLQPALYGIAQGGQAATQAFNALGIEGAGAVSGLTSGLAAMGSAAFVAGQVIAELGKTFIAAYEQQKEFTFQSGLLSKQLGTTAEEGAKTRSLLALVGQENNIFASITLSQIQASVASLDRVDRGLEKASPQVEKFGVALKQLGISYTDQNGKLKNFLDLIVEMSASLQKLDASSRSLAIQELAGLFGGDVAKLFGFGPEILARNMDNAVAVSKDLQAANDQQRESVSELSNAWTEFNSALLGGLTWVEAWWNFFQSSVVKNFTQEIINLRAGLGVATGIEGNPEALQSLADRQKKAVDDYKTFIANSKQSDLYTPDLAQTQQDQLALLEERYQKTLDLIKKAGEEVAKGKLADVVSDVKLKERATETEKALKAVDDADKKVLDTQKAIVKNNEEVAKSFESEIAALEKTGAAYDNFYTKIGDLDKKIADIQKKEGKPFSYVGTGSVKDVEKALLDVQYTEARIVELEPKADKKSEQVNLERLRKKARDLRAALGLQPGEDAILANVDITVGTTKLSADDKKKLNDYFQQIVELRKQFLQGGFDVTRDVFGELLGGLTNLSGAEFQAVLTGGAAALQQYADALGLFTSPGFAQAIAETGLRTKLLAGGFGDLNTAAGANEAFAKYLQAFGDLRKDLFNLSTYIGDPKQLKLDTIFSDLENYKKNPKKFEIPIAISLGLLTEEQVAFAGQDVNTLFGQGKVNEAQQVISEKAKIANLGTGKGIVDSILAKYGLNAKEAIKATAQFSIDGKFDTSLADKQAKATADDLKKREEARKLVITWYPKIVISPTFDTTALRNAIAILDAAGVVTDPSDTSNRTIPGAGRAAGGPVHAGMPYLVGEQGKPEFFIPRSDGRIIPGNETASLMRLFSVGERLPMQPIINYSPVVSQVLNVDARGTNARDVTQAIKRASVRPLFTSTSDLIRGRDFLRARGL